MADHLVYPASEPRSALVFNGADFGDFLSSLPETGASVLVAGAAAPLAVLKDLMNEATRIHGQALLVDVVSAPRIEADVTINDLNGCSCSPYITVSTAAIMSDHGLRFQFNKLNYSSVIKDIMDHSAGHHTIQIQLADDLWNDNPHSSDKMVVKEMLNALSVKLAKLMVA
ncbi:MAG: hypothetical protein JWO78_2259 [Micavibrio sp.]|nr:hypothetical protein [Micavibrio sp.]